MKDKDKEKEKDEDEELKNLINELSEGDSPEDINKFIEGLENEMKRNKNNMGVAYMFGLVLHKKPIIHLLLVILFNFSLISALEGFFHFVEFESLLTFGLSILLFTLVEFLVKMMLIKFCLKAVLSTFGAIFLILQIGYMELMHYFLPGFEFKGQVYLIAFVIVFILSRYVITRVGHIYVNNIIKRRN